MYLNQTEPERKVINASVGKRNVNVLWIIVTMTQIWQMARSQLPSQTLRTHAIAMAQLLEWMLSATAER